MHLSLTPMLVVPALEMKRRVGRRAGKEVVLSNYVFRKKKNHLRLDSNFLSVSSFSKHSPAAIC